MTPNYHAPPPAPSPATAPISPRLEMGAYETLWLAPNASFKTLAELFAQNPGKRPSDFTNHPDAEANASRALAKLLGGGVRNFSTRIHGTGEYPIRLRDARHPVELLYYQGAWELAETRAAAVVGTRDPSPESIKRAQRVARELAERGITVISGLARGIDTAALRSAIEAGGKVIGVIGTPLGVTYPPENRKLQERIAEEHLLISQVPLLRYAAQTPQHNRFFFPERNATMSALSEATIIVEAGETSGTLTQARAAIYQRRKLLILESCFQHPGLKWPARYEAQGAIRIRTSEDLARALP
ncbi:DNA-processing protein DprA [Sphingopyxis sp. YR583]|uniref:DNA-processing protein DprA n=1 Tax=Sphingopyxis sp. YR583 TaxID=1881047 RepID=UPI00210DDE9F|nr:DNA-processing protein DprA [Sphingopyxis sp. YR583]